MVFCTTSSYQSSFLHYLTYHLNGACCHWCPFVIDAWTTAGDHGDFNDFDDFGFWMVKFEISKSKVGRFQSTMGNTIFLVATHPVCHFPSFQSSSSIRVH
jgi:hypothetical protein